jgi:hypothetical protein
MIWLTWRQFRTQAWTAAAALTAAAAILAITGPHLAHLYDASGFATCRSHGDCQLLTSQLLSELSSGTGKILDDFGIWVLYAVPGVIGMFWGAPLVASELESGAYRLVWNQSISPAHWLAVKLALTGLASMTAAGLLSLMVTWWSRPIDQVAGNRFTPLMLGARGVIPIGSAAFAFALGVAAGLLIRRVVPAMAVTLIVFASTLIVISVWVLPHIIPPVHHNLPLTAEMWYSAPDMTVAGGPAYATVTIPGAWVLTKPFTPVLNSAGQVAAGLPRTCLGGADPTSACFARLHLHVAATYQPASRYWPFQWCEMAFFLTLALALAAFCLWRIRRLSGQRHPRQARTALSRPGGGQ